MDDCNVTATARWITAPKTSAPAGLNYDDATTILLVILDRRLPDDA
jgi:hypothetical protein